MYNVVSTFWCSLSFLLLSKDIAALPSHQILPRQDENDAPIQNVQITEDTKKFQSLARPDNDAPLE